MRFYCDEQEREIKMNKHTMANEYKTLCFEADDIIKKPNDTLTSNGWKKVDGEYNKDSNFKAVLYEKDGQYALCFIGTDVKNIKDLGADLKMGVTGNSKQIQQANDFTQKMKKAYGLTSDNTVSIGHSEGGTEATIVGLENGLKTITYNAYGIWKSKYDNNNYDYSLVTNYHDPHDPISKIHKNVGETYIVPSAQNWFMSTTPLGFPGAHRLNEMGDCENAVPKEEYKKNNKWFIDKISDADISREDIKNMEPELFSLYEKEIDKKMAKNEIKQKSSYKLANNSKDGKWVTINGNHVLISN